jgi:hypothetical protein
MILTDLQIDQSELEARTHWKVTSDGACKAGICIPLPAGASTASTVDARILADRIGAPLLHDEDHGIWCLGPESLGGRVLLTADAPELELPDINGRTFLLRSLRGSKVLLLAWASY